MVDVLAMYALTALTLKFKLVPKSCEYRRCEKYAYFLFGRLGRKRLRVVVPRVSFWSATSLNIEGVIILHIFDVR